MSHRSIRAFACALLSVLLSTPAAHAAVGAPDDHGYYWADDQEFGLEFLDPMLADPPVLELVSKGSSRSGLIP